MLKKKVDWWLSSSGASQGELRPLPDGFTYDPGFNFYYNESTGEYSTDFVASDYDFSDETDVTYYFHAESGNDSNDGLSAGSPKLTISTVVTALNSAIPANGATFILLGNEFNGTTGFTGGVINFDLVVKSGNPLGAKVRCCKKLLSGFTLTKEATATNVYRYTKSSDVAMPVDLTWLDAESGKPRRFETVASIAACDALPGSAFVGTNNAYFHTFDSRDPIGDPNVYCNRPGGVIAPRGNRYYLENIEFWGAGGGVCSFTNANTDPAILVAKGCDFGWGSANAFALTLDDQATVFLEDCNAFNATADGFNYHNLAGGTPEVNGPSAVEINCRAFRNGYNAGGNNQGSTAHDGTDLIRINCRYYKNQHQNVLDVSNLTKVWHMGCQFDDAPINIGVENAGGSNGATHWHDGSVSTNASNKDLEVVSGTFKYKNMDISGWDTTNTGGTITTY